METFGKRLALIINDLGLKKNSFSELLKYTNNTPIYDYTRDDDKAKLPGFDFFKRIIQAKKGINIEWLITGEGERFIKKGTAATIFDEAAINDDDKISWLMIEMKLMKEKVRNLERDLRDLKPKNRTEPVSKN